MMLAGGGEIFGGGSLQRVRGPEKKGVQHGVGLAWI